MKNTVYKVIGNQKALKMAENNSKIKIIIDRNIHHCNCRPYNNDL